MVLIQNIYTYRASQTLTGFLIYIYINIYMYFMLRICVWVINESDCHIRRPTREGCGFTLALQRALSVTSPSCIYTCSPVENPPTMPRHSLIRLYISSHSILLSFNLSLYTYIHYTCIYTHTHTQYHFSQCCEPFCESMDYNFNLNKSTKYIFIHGFCCFI